MSDRVRISLDVETPLKESIHSHGVELKTYNITATLREAVRRSRWLTRMEKRGKLLLVETIDGEDDLVDLTPGVDP